MLRLITLLLFALPLAAAPVPKAVKKATADGVWEVTEWSSRGRAVNSTLTVRWTIDGETLAIERTSTNPGVIVRPPQNPPAYTLAKADKDDPTAVDYSATYPGGERVVKYPGRMEVDGDTLRFCFDVSGTGTRPAECKAGDTVTYYVFKRVKAEDK